MALATDAKQDEALPGGVWNTLKAAALQWLDHKDAKAGAAIAYYSIFSIGPLIVVADLDCGPGLWTRGRAGRGNDCDQGLVGR